MSLAYRIAQKQSRGIGRPIARVKTTPAPVLGWNAKDPLQDMKAGYATILENWFPQAGYCELRKGYASHATDVGAAAVESLFPYDSGGTQVLLAAGAGDIYDATATGSATNLNSGTAFSDDLWQGVNFYGVAILVNGSSNDKAQSYDGSTLASSGLAFLATAGNSGFDSANMIYVWHSKERLFMVENNTANFWYGTVKGITGSIMAKYELGAVHRDGGNLVCGGTFTVDGGQGPDDYVAFFFENGDVLVYQGTNPGDADNWSIVGRFKIGRPIGRIPLVQIGPDLIAITTDGYMPVRQFMTSGRTQKNLAVSDNIAPAVSKVVKDFGTLQGWSLTLYPDANMLIANVPTVAGAQSRQHVMNTLTGAWCKFTGINANCWAVLGSSIYFGGGSGAVYQFNTTNADAGDRIEADAQTAYKYYLNEQQAEYVLYRAWLQADNPVNVQMGLGVDFMDAIVTSEQSSVASGGEQFDVAMFDTSFFAGGLTAQDDWQTAGEIGYAAAIRLKTSTDAHNVRWFANSVAYKPGGVVG